MRLFVALAGLLVAASSVQAQTSFAALTYTYSGVNAAPTINVTPHLTNVSTISMGAGLKNVPMMNAINSYRWTSHSSEPFVNDYYEVSFTAAIPVSIIMIEGAWLSSAKGPTQVQLRSSLDNFAEAVDIIGVTPGEIMHNNFGLHPMTYEMGVGDTMTFRMYGTDSSSSGFRSQLGLVSVDTAPALSIWASPIGAPVPEPTTILGVMFVGLLGRSILRWVR